MKAMRVAALSHVAELHPASAFAPSLPEARPARPSVWQRILAWHRLAQERRRLLELDDHMLRDIGVTREEAHREASRSFWDWDHNNLR